MALKLAYQFRTYIVFPYCWPSWKVGDKTLEFLIQLRKQLRLAQEGFEILYGLDRTVFGPLLGRHRKVPKTAITAFAASPVETKHCNRAASERSLLRIFRLSLRELTSTATDCPSFVATMSIPMSTILTSRAT
jgi:hypothetical protein